MLIYGYKLFLLVDHLIGGPEKQFFYFLFGERRCGAFQSVELMIALPDHFPVGIIAVPDFRTVPAATVAALDLAGENADRTLTIPALLAGVILAGILASTMSTADSQLIAASSAVSKNIFGVLKIKHEGKASVIAARATLIVISVIAAFLARNPDSSVFGIVSFAWAGFGASFGPVVLFALFWRRSNRFGAIAGLLVGGIMVFVWKYLVRPMGGVWDVYELLPAFIAASAAIIIVSLLTEEPSKEIVEEFDRVSSLKD